MDAYDVKRLALILAVQADIEAMKVENTMRKMNMESPAHPSEHFTDKAMELRNIAYAHNEQL